MSSVPDWGLLVHPKDGHRKVFCVLHAYFDDSGTHKGAPICVLAGYFGGEKHWVKFDEEWGRALDNERLEEFHANRFWAHLNGSKVAEYEGWDRDRANRFITRLLQIIGSRRLYPVGSFVVMKDWEVLPRDEKAVLTGARYSDGKLVTPGAPNKTYFLPFASCVQGAARHCGAGLLMHFSFDQNDYLSRYALEYFKYLKTLQWDTAAKLGEIFFADSKRATPLQAADLLAYELNRSARDMVARGAESMRRSIVLRRALKKLKHRADLLPFGKRGIDIALATFRKQKAAAGKGET